MKNKKPARIFVVLVSLTVFALLIASILFLIASCENKDGFVVPSEVNGSYNASDLWSDKNKYFRR